MATTSRDRDRERLEQEIQTKEYQELLIYLQPRFSFLRRFVAWADVIAFMRSGSSRDPRKDEILRPIFGAHREDSNPRWRTILMTIFWPALKSIHIKKRHWDDDTDELWQNIVWTFLKVVCRVNVERRPNRLVQKVYCETVHHLHDEYQRIWTRAKREPAMDAAAIEALAGAVEGIDFEGIDLRKAHQREVNWLRGHLDAGRITEADFLLLVGTRLYGQSIAEYARGAGLNTEAAKKRRQRAEAAILHYEKELR
jgi:hypothetical protein